MTASIRLITFAAIACAVGCAGHQIRGQSFMPREGVYAVVSRTCRGPNELEQECTRVRYIEIVRGTFYGIAKQQLAIVKWIAQDEKGPYIYSARSLGGRVQDPGLYTIDELKNDLYASREWLALSDNQLKEYGYHRQPVAASAATTKVLYLLQLAPVPRDAALSERIPYPPPVIDE